MKFYNKLILTSSAVCLLVSCANTYSINSYDDNIFEIIYSSERDNSDARNAKQELLAAYAAEARGCEKFKRYSGVQSSHRSGYSVGIITTRRTVAQLYQCTSDGGKSTKQVIQIQESRYGSLRNMKRK